ncbi:MAG: hypothetical protein ACO3DB_03800 [Candidatus Limnocylindrus sp.]
MDDLRRYLASPPPVTGRRAITTSDAGEVRNPDPGDRTAWRDWVSASKTRNWLRRDPLLDWLEVHGSAKGFSRDAGADAKPPSPYDLREMLFAQGSRFETRIFEILEPMVRSHRLVSDGWQATRTLAAAESTFEAMCEGVELIEQAVVRNPEDQTYGAIDLLVRSDAIERLFPGTLSAEEAARPAPALAPEGGEARPWHYVVVDVKFSTLDLSVNGFAGSSHRHYAGQVLVYTAAIARLQGYCPPDAFLLGRTWVSSKGRGSGALDRLARVPIDRESTRDGETPLAVEVGRALEWIRTVRRDGGTWEALPRPTRPELYPNMNADQDQPWSEAKRLIAQEIGELTYLPGVGPDLRDAAVAAGALRRDQPGLTPERLGVTGDARPRRLAAVLAANAIPASAPAAEKVLPARIELRDDQHWRRPARIEFYVDFENSGNLNDDFTALPLVGGATCIFQIGCHVAIDGREPTAEALAAANAAGAVAGERLFSPRSEDQDWFPSFGQWSGDRLTPTSERAVLDAWLSYMSAWRASLGVSWSETRIVHWSPAERNLLFTAADSAASRHPTWKLPEEIGWFDAFDELVYRVPVSVRGAYGYGLKEIAKSMRAAGLIDVSWGDGPADGMGAMAAAYTADARAAAEGKRLADYDYFRAGAEYNAADCRSMYLVLAWLRANR